MGCPAGCGCSMFSEAESMECACDGPCTGTYAPKPRWENLDAENGARLLRAVLRDLDTVADRLERVANAFTELSHNERVRLNAEAPDLTEALVMVEHYHAGRRVPRDYPDAAPDTERATVTTRAREQDPSL